MNENLVKIINSGMKLLMIILLAYVIAKQAVIIKVIYDEKDKLDADPLAYGAKIYGINDCTCLVNENYSINFNPASSKKIIFSKAPNLKNITINWSSILNGTS